MGTIEILAGQICCGLREAIPRMRKTILKKLPLAVAAMIEARTANTMEWPTVLPLGRNVRTGGNSDCGACGPTR